MDDSTAPISSRFITNSMTRQPPSEIQQTFYNTMNVEISFFADLKC